MNNGDVFFLRIAEVVSRRSIVKNCSNTTSSNIKSPTKAKACETKSLLVSIPKGHVEYISLSTSVQLFAYSRGRDIYLRGLRSKYSVVNIQKTMENHRYSNGKIHYKGPFSTFHFYQRVHPKIPHFLPARTALSLRK